MAYIFVQVGSVAGNPPTVSPTGIYRTLRCRIFDASGDVIGYGFTTNPTWQMIETLLRFQIKPQQPCLAGLTTAEKALFDWPAIVAHAARNATILPNGAPTFAGNFSWAADASLNNMMEQQLRNCLSFRRIRGGQIQFVGEESRASTFVVSQKTMFGGSLNMNEKDLTNVANVYVPQYRELGIPAICQVDSVTTVEPGQSVSTGLGGALGQTTTYWTSLFTTIGPQPFAPGNIFCYGGSSNDAQFAGLYGAGGVSVTVNGQVQQLVDSVANQIRRPALRSNRLRRPEGTSTRCNRVSQSMRRTVCSTARINRPAAWLLRAFLLRLGSSLCSTTWETTPSTRRTAS
jgi:hypothetical protein